MGGATAGTRRRASGNWAGGLAALALIAVYAVCAPIAATAATPPDSVTMSAIGPGSMAPLFSGTTLDGQAVSIEGYRGKPLILCFWGSW